MKTMKKNKKAVIAPANNETLELKLTETDVPKEGTLKLQLKDRAGTWVDVDEGDVSIVASYDDQGKSPTEIAVQVTSDLDVHGFTLDNDGAKAWDPPGRGTFKVPKKPGKKNQADEEDTQFLLVVVADGAAPRVFDPILVIRRINGDLSG